MAKAKAEMPVDMWLHVATDALARYAAGGGELAILEATTNEGTAELVIYLGGLTIDDPRLSSAFADIYGRAPVVVKVVNANP